MSIRDAYGESIASLYYEEKIVVLDADLAKSTRTIKFKNICSERFFDMGIAEQNMVGTAAGLAVSGKIPFVSTFAIFVVGRAFEQIRNSICYPRLNVKIAATHAGITVGSDGATHQAIEDISLMRSLPNMIVLVPSDYIETKAMINFIIEYNGPVYIRISRMLTTRLHNKNFKFNLGRGEVLKDGSDIAIIATGIMVEKGLKVALELEKEGIDISVVNMSTIKPLDKELIVSIAKKTGKILTVEEHSIIGGLGSAVSEVLSQEFPIKMKIVGIKDIFGQSGTPNELLENYGLTEKHIKKHIRQLMEK